MKKSRKLRSEKGASIILAIMLLLVITLFCSSLFYIMSTSTKNAAQEKDREQTLLLAQSLSKVVQTQVEDNSTSLHSYLSEHVGKGWGYYNPDEVFNANKDAVTRTFSSGIDESGLEADVKMSIYWTSDGDSEAKKDWAGGKRTLYITITVQMKDAKSAASAITSAFDYVKDTDSENYHWEYRGGV